MKESDILGIVMHRRDAEKALDKRRLGLNG